MFASMRRNFIHFLQPAKLTLVLFLLAAISIPVYYVYSEPERTNYHPGEKQIWTVKTRIYESVFEEFVFHTEGSPEMRNF